MKTTTGDKIAFACVLGVLLLIAGGWVCARAVEQHEQLLTQTAYSQPTPELRLALAAGDPDDADAPDDIHLARGR